VFPFLPLFIQDDLGVGVDDPGKASLWSGLAGAAMGIAMFFSGPIWGVLGDRYGHKKNVMRALLGGVVVMILTGLSANVYHLVIFRFLSGLLSGNISPIMAIASAQVPRDRIRTTMSMLQMAQFMGLAVGPLVGGQLSEAIGFRGTFFAAAGLLALGTVATFVWIRETPREASTNSGMSIWVYSQGFLQLLRGRPFLIMMLVMFMVFAAPAMAHPVLSVLVREMDPVISASAITGYIFCVMGLASAVASLGVSHLGASIGLRRILGVSAFVGGIIYGLMFVAQNLAQVFLIIGLVGFFSGAMMATATASVALMVPRDKQGRAFGAVQSVVSMSFGLGPLLGGSVAALVGLKEVFLVSAAFFIIVAVLVSRVTHIGESALPSVEEARVTA
jgi:DHA1 family multidrug resistance protein-like MFS transporter